MWRGIFVAFPCMTTVTIGEAERRSTATGKHVETLSQQKE
jgi:hypothetical protein